MKKMVSMRMMIGAFSIAIALAWSSQQSANATNASSTSLGEKITRHAQKAGVPVPLAKAVIRLESNFRPGIASKGNYGLMQIRLGTARSMGYRGGPGGLLDADTNLTYGMKYLARAYSMARGDTCGTIMRYQSGLGATRMNSANRAYCGRARVLMARS
ncbi:MAG: lytic transglycosylase domain-containing protein [Bosea sp. (in: a-proteobacteria)]